MKKRAVPLVLFCLFISSLSAVPMEFYLGGSFYADRDYISRDTSDSFPTMNIVNNASGVNIKDPSLYYIDNIRRLGIGMELAYFPYAPIKIGITANYQLLIPIGFQRCDKETDTATGVETYKNHSFIAKHNFNIGLAYYQLFGSSGFYVDAGGAIAVHTIPDINDKNSKKEITYSSFTEYGVYGDFGFLLMHNDAYFKIGTRIQSFLSYENVGITAAITLSGGYRFAF